MIIKTSYPFMKPPPSARLIRGHRLAQGLVGFWLFNEGSGNKVFDLSGNGKNGTFIDGPIWIKSNLGSAVNFPDVAGEHILVGSSSIYDITEFSFHIWLKTDGIGGVGSPISKRDDYNGKNWALYEGGSEWEFQWGNNDAGGGRTVFNGQGAWNTIGEWGSCGVSYKLGEQKIYINGVLASSATDSTPMSNFGDSLRFGILQPSTSDVYQGNIDHIYFYNRILTASEFAELYWKPFGMFERKARTALMSGYEVVAPPVGMAGAMTTNSGYWGW